MQKDFKKSHKLDGIGYDIRGPVLERARQMEEEGQTIIKLNVGNLAPFGFNPPDEIVQDMIRRFPKTAGYTDSKGLYESRKAVVHYTQTQGIEGVTVDDVYLGNGASELITLAVNALLNEGDEVLIPSPDYPLWTAVVKLAGGKPVHYMCDEAHDWQPSISDIQNKITEKTKAIVIINPNNPTGAVYSQEVLQQIVSIAEEKSLIIFADEVYDKILYDGAVHISLAKCTKSTLVVVFNSLSKSYRACGYRGGWMYLAGNKEIATSYIEGLNMLSSMRLCANTPGQIAIQTALGGYQSIEELVGENGRLRMQRDVSYELLSQLPGIKVSKPRGALYIFVGLDEKIYDIKNDQDFVLELLEKEKVLVVQGSGFNYPGNHHFRFIFLPYRVDLSEAISRIARFLETKRKR